MNTRQRPNQQARFRRASFNSLVLSSLFVCCLSILFVSADLTRKADSTGYSAPSDDSSGQRIDLSGDWTYAREQGTRAPGELPSPPSDGWNDWDPKASWKFSRKLVGNYWFKKTFSARWGFESPAMVLGKIPGSHRVYLNGHQIGGADQAEPLAFYPFEPTLLKTDGPNTLWVSVRALPTRSPGITEMRNVGMFVGDIQDVRQHAVTGATHFHVKRSVQLALSMSLFLGALGFAVFQRAHRHYFYGALYLLLASLQCAAFHPWVGLKLDFFHTTLLEAVGFCLAPFALFSAYLHLKRRYFAEGVNNAVALVAMTAGSAYLFHGKHGLLASYDFVVSCALAYGFVTFAYAAIDTSLRFRKDSEKRASQSPVFQTLFLAFGIASSYSVAQLSAPSDWANAWLETWSVSSAFVFTFMALMASALDQAFHRRAIARKNSRDQLVMGLIRLIHDSPDITDAVVSIQNRVSSFLKARRSTLYLLSPGNAGTATSGEALLKATYIHGGKEVRQDVKHSVPADKGVIGYACKHRAPLLIEDIRQDPRFADVISKRQEDDQKYAYQTGTCMIFPLVSGSNLLGVLTFADKKGQAPFSHEDFAIALEVANDLALLLDSRQLQDSLRKKAK